jgi:hypothetical protein
MPLHVVAGFLESDRGMRDSGVLPVNMVEREAEATIKERDEERNQQTTVMPKGLENRYARLGLQCIHNSIWR